jgi:signal transduction histidine kinase
MTTLSKSARYAAAVALGYALLAGAYIVVSSSLAAGASHSVEEMRRIETVKGIVFVVVTGGLVFAGAWAALRRLERDARELVRRERALIAAEGRVFAGLIASTVAHDANNVLTAVLLDVEELSNHEGERERKRATRLRGAVERLVELNRRLMSASRLGVQRDVQRIELLDAVQRSVTAIRTHAHLRTCKLDVRGDGEVAVAANPMLVDQIVTNLVLNAAEATGGRGQVDVHVLRNDREAVVEVHDDGPGVPAERRDGLFDALATTKPSGNGLGLFSVKACARSFGGYVEVGDSPLGGALFRVRLPAARA